MTVVVYCGDDESDDGDSDHNVGGSDHGDSDSGVKYNKRNEIKSTTIQNTQKVRHTPDRLDNTKNH